MEMVASQLAEIGAKKDGKIKKEATIYLMMLGYVICLDY